MKFKLYISEIKNRILLLVLSLIICTLTSYYYKETLLFLTIKNLESPNLNTPLYFISTNLTEIITAYLKLSYISSIVLVINLTGYHLLLFFGPALTINEYFTTKKYFIKSVICFFLGFFIFNKYLMPMCWNFFLNFQDLYSIKTINIYFEGKMEEYINFYTKICFLLFIISQFCISLFLILDTIKEKIKFVRRSRKMFYLVFLIISTMITPPDVFSQLITLLCFSLVFEGLILITMFKYHLIRKPIKA